MQLLHYVLCYSVVQDILFFIDLPFFFFFIKRLKPQRCWGDKCTLRYTFHINEKMVSFYVSSKELINGRILIKNKAFHSS